MDVGRLLGFAAIIAVVGAVGLYFAGILQFEDGGIKFDSENVANPTAIDPYTSAAVLYNTLQYKEALPAYEKALKDNLDHPDAGEAKYRIGKCHKELHQYAEAKKAYERFVKEHPKHSAVKNAKRDLTMMGLTAP